MNQSQVAHTNHFQLTAIVNLELIAIKIYAINGYNPKGQAAKQTLYD